MEGSQSRRSVSEGWRGGRWLGLFTERSDKCHKLATHYNDPFADLKETLTDAGHANWHTLLSPHSNPHSYLCLSWQFPLCPVDGSRVTQTRVGEKKSWVWVSPDGEWQRGALLRFSPQAGRYVLSTLFNQVSIKAERDPSDFFLSTASLQCDRYSGFRSKRPATRQGKQELERKRTTPHSVESVGGGFGIEKLRIWYLNTVKWRPWGLENLTRKNKSRRLTQGFFTSSSLPALDPTLNLQFLSLGWM